MREIKYRGKRIDNGEWVCGGNIITCQERAAYICASGSGLFIRGKTIITLDGAHEVDPETIGQYTGLHDKNGKEIYEGDFCRITRCCVLCYGEITFENGCFWFKDDGPGGFLRLCDIRTNNFEIEIIGNTRD